MASCVISPELISLPSTAQIFIGDLLCVACNCSLFTKSVLMKFCEAPESIKHCVDAVTFPCSISVCVVNVDCVVVGVLNLMCDVLRHLLGWIMLVEHMTVFVISTTIYTICCHSVQAM